jgi:hypothetical protein
MSRRADDPIDDQANALMDLGQVLGMAGKHDEAAREAGQGLALYEKKGNLVAAAAARRFMAEASDKRQPGPGKE